MKVVLGWNALALPSSNSYNYLKEVEGAARIFNEHGNFIHAVIRSRVKNHAQADDLFQDFFLSLVCKPPPAGIKKLKSYLFAAITNDIADAARRVEKYQARMHRYAEHLRYITANGDPEKTLAGAEEMNRAFELIERRLQPSEARAIILRYRDDFSIQEVAQTMRVDNRSVSKYLYKGLKKIRQLLKIEEDECDDRSQS